ncbi:ketosteroid isomerase [Shewanella hanedai]|jgi:ketosteroid isomerase-like protein|uniref:Nuclear transport factor 2 family protein n=1 Tax=Shewanella hanedai TaxID=25 RepID=A0A553JPD4_SHEHA|nr:nuclear transport factor 2 family protein [Shewanella hanedai]TRY14290.1 nuclear transport factor 2 family protein [Shewanella hanedai]GGI81298.1 ketosteroid isomerase [Shewanella hanedai]
MKNNTQQGTNLSVINSYFNALANGDMETFASTFAEGVVWHQPGRNKFSGDKRSFSDIGAMIGGMMEDSLGSFAVKPITSAMANEDLVSVPVHFSGKKNSAEIDMQGLDLFRLEGGKIIEVWLFSENQSKEDAFWG